MKESALWSGAIHLNTDNTHIHVAICEPNPTKTRGKRTKSTMLMMKSKFVNELIKDKEIYKEINKSIRANIVDAKKDFSSLNDREMKKLFFSAISNLPDDKRHWHYGYNTMKNANVYIDKMTTHYINTYKKDEFNELCNKLDEHELFLKSTYGVGQNQYYKDYKKNKINDLYKRMGNTILSEIKDYVSEKENDVNKNKLKSVSINSVISKKDLNKIKKSLESDFESQKNIQHYKNLQSQISDELEL